MPGFSRYNRVREATYLMKLRSGTDIGFRAGLGTGFRAGLGTGFRAGLGTGFLAGAVGDLVET